MAFFFLVRLALTTPLVGGLFLASVWLFSGWFLFVFFAALRLAGCVTLVLAGFCYFLVWCFSSLGLPGLGSP